MTAKPTIVRPEDACNAAIQAVNAAGQLPPALLAAIGRVESGRLDAHDGAVKAWPWTVNAEGRGTLFDSKDDAIAAVVALQSRGVTSIDVGCMQVNLAWHPTAFATLADAFDPRQNVTYAARFLLRLHAATADWDAAAARYHSSTPEVGLPYLQKVLAQATLRPCTARPRARASDQLASVWAATLSSVAGRDPAVQVPGAWAAAPVDRQAAQPLQVPPRAGLRTTSFSKTCAVSG